ncbi:RluA family pseudouridine synthase [Candidatus Saccharibacteria bacterium]|nr:RluA family pseudouridine synthase [Candidatus Saccharibacteria bacterium]
MIITGKKFSKPAMSRVINGDVVLEKDETKPEKFRLDQLLVEKFPEYNRSTLQKFIREGYVTVNGDVETKPAEKIEKTAALDLSVPMKSPLRKEIAPPVIYEDENVLVVNKPSGLLSMGKGEFCVEPTLEDFGLLVHRLDRGTSGVIILAKNEPTQTMLRRQFQERHAHKVYYAVVKGRPKLDEAKIDLPIARNYNHHATFQVDPNGRESITFYKVLKSNGDVSLVELRPVTGRTHQLRIHLKYLGTPILGDYVYGGEEVVANRVGENIESKDRLMLHAKSLEITIPGKTPEDNNVRMTFEAPVPEEFFRPFED